MKSVIVFALLAVVVYGQKSVDAPQPALIEIPSQEVVVPAPAPAVISETIHTSVNVPSAMIEVPKQLEQVVDVPHTPLVLPPGGVQEQSANIDIPQPVIQVPGPVIQHKPVVYNVPQDIIQVPQPIIRHRPVLYTVPHILRMATPIITQQQEIYNVPQAHLLKSAFQPPPPPKSVPVPTYPTSFKG